MQGSRFRTALPDSYEDQQIKLAGHPGSGLTANEETNSQLSFDTRHNQRLARMLLCIADSVGYAFG